MTTKIQALKKLLKKHKIAAYIVPTTNEFQNQFTPEHLARLKYLTNFTGSKGIAVITSAGKDFFFTDGRYTLQAELEIDKSFKVINTKDQTLEDWLIDYTNKGHVVGFDPRLHTFTQVKVLLSKLKKPALLVSTQENLVDIVWKDRASQTQNVIVQHPLKYTGQSTKSKLTSIVQHLKTHKLFGIIITDTTSICWLLNIRGNNLPFTPTIQAHLIVFQDGKLELFTDDILQTPLHNVKTSPLSSFSKALELLKDKRIQLSRQAPYSIANVLKKHVIADDPCLLPKACKNKTEIKGAATACMRDSKALMQAFKWIKDSNNVTELDVVDQLVKFRSKQKNFVHPSFPSIVAFKENAALAHYSPSKRSNKKITGNGLLLIDSGGQYLDGTTDITRTFAIGKPTKEQIHNFTLVLKGHIRLITSVFPEGTSGTQLDAFARLNLWQEGKDYDHGTGHGVGHFLNVHEGPQNIVKNAPHVPLHEGMIVSIEPGFYKPHEYGIRIENLAYVKKSKFAGYMTFEVLTYVLIDETLVNFSILTKEEERWLKIYNKKCYEVCNNT